ncbi:energy-coupled thiamine transporter ThiT [Lachnobacterium bovis]|uniref:Thiamine transporter n=1 Tax=Lachnobacterium bovis TaxID=140626 RepID=A0A1H9RX79_9FIRM|nr:energy-coupled thiamine transporter ThiT [Lachnobacterium bovis]SER76509.1 thiamine transporter [Lachnobacterium bovis]
MSLFIESSATSDGTTYTFTKLGTTSIVLAIIAILLISCALLGKKTKITSRQLAFTSLTLALAFLASFIKLFQMPMGGSVTLFSMFFITLIGYWYGLSVGITAGISFGLLQLIINPYILCLPQVITDYILAFGSLGLSGIFSKSKNGLLKGYVVGVFGRFFFAVLSGVIFFGNYSSFLGMSNSLLYSIIYNGSYLFAEMILTIIFLLASNYNKNFNMGISYITKLATNRAYH